MKVIVTGATGNAGRATLDHCLTDDRITKVFVLSRRALPDEISNNTKVEVIIHSDFLQYPDSLMDQLAGAEVCLWYVTPWARSRACQQIANVIYRAIGGNIEQFHGNKEKCRQANVDFTLAGANAMREKLAAKAPNGKFRFVFCSGKFAEWDQDKTLLFMSDSRKIKGFVEKSLGDLADAHPDTFEAWMLQPSGFLENDAPAWKKAIGGLYGAIPTSQVGKAMVKVGVEGWKDRIISNDVMLKM